MDNIKDIFAYITDRVQKITSALYRVTDLLSDKEPLKWTLREKAVTFFDSIMSVRFLKDKEFAIHESLNNCAHVIKALELVSAGTCISNMNFDILRKEYSRLKDFLDGKKIDIISEQKLLPEFFIADKKIRETKHEFDGVKNTMPSVVSNPVSNAQEDQIDLMGRKGKILDFLKMSDAKTVGEIHTMFNGVVSEKAIQRDLFDLVKRGKIITKGEKRWRKYEYIRDLVKTA